MTVRTEWRKYQAQAIEAIKADRELQLYLILAIVLVFGGGGYSGYRWYAKQRAEKAQQAFAASLEGYQQALAMQFVSQGGAEDKRALWEQVEVDVQHASQQFSGTTYAPFFTVFLAHALNYQGKRDAALATMRTALDKFGSHNPYRGLYQVTLDLMLLDGSPEEQKTALVDLQKYADDAASTVQDMALYYLGIYYSTVGDQTRATDYWKRAQALPRVQEQLPQAQSPWQQFAQMKLTELGVDG
jgi:predicted negative regulator of RcsB-dependent stress response